MGKRLQVLLTLMIALLLDVAWLRAQAVDPESSRLVTTDITNFWRAIDRAAAGDSAALVNAIHDEYIAKASPGLRDFMMSRLIDRSSFGRLLQQKGWDEARARRSMNAAANSSERASYDSVVTPLLQQHAALMIARTYLSRRSYYNSIRANTLAVDTAQAVRDSIRASFRRMKELYPDATFADVYFLIGRMTSGGTISNGSLLIGTEIFGRDASTPTHELGAWEKAVTGEIKNLPHIVAHEYVHTLQGRRQGKLTLLAAALGEGTADFIAELISGSHIINPAYDYGDANETRLWAEFRLVMDSTDTSNWLYQGNRSTNRPADLGYWMGYKIAKAYYDKATDKHAAVREILLFKDPVKFLEASGYGR